LANVWRHLNNESRPSVDILPFDIDGTINVLQNEQRETICTGNREVCAALFEMMNQPKAVGRFEPTQEQSHANVCSAIMI